MKEIFIDGVAEYQYELKDRTHNLYFNKGEQWCADSRGELAMSITDTGNKLKLHNIIKSGNINYMEGLHLTILLKIIHCDYKFEMADKIQF